MRGHQQSIDGLRGYLALMVFVHHSADQRGLYKTGEWSSDSWLFGSFGKTGVMFFFMITAYLFWGKVVAGGGRINVRTLYWRRFLRLAPLCLIYALITLLIVGFETHFVLKVPLTVLATEVFRKLSLGLLIGTHVNGLPTVPIDAGVLWTLQYEWKFYLLLPFAGVLAFAIGSRIFLVLGWILTVALLMLQAKTHYLDGRPDLAQSLARFLSGMTIVHVVGACDLKGLVARPWFNYALAALLAFCFITAYTPFGFVFGALAFACFVYGANLFGILSAAGSWMLGTISYSIYLVHPLVLHLVLRAANLFSPVESMNDIVYWSVIMLAGFILVGVSTMTYRWIEHPFIARSHDRKSNSTESEGHGVGGSPAAIRGLG